MRQLLLLFLLAIAVLDVQSQSCTGPGREPGTANAVCGNITFKQDQVFNCTGAGNLPNTSAGCGDIVTTDNSIWYKFHCYQAGQLGFLLTPRFAGDDFDWEIVDITGRPPSDVYNVDLRVSLNLSGQTGPTGCTPTGTLDVHCGGGGAGTQFNQLINLLAGHDYLMMVNNWSSSGQGYDIDFSGTAVLTNNAAPTITSAAIAGCDASKINVVFSEDMLCSSITTAGTEFTVTDGANTIIPVDVTSACTAGANGVPSLVVNLPAALAPGSYTLAVNTGSDGDIFRNVCRVEMLATTIPFTVVAQPPLEVSAVNFTSCAPTVLDITFTKPFLCYSVAGNGSDFFITPGNPPISSVSYNCPGGRTNTLKINLQNPLPHGSYKLNVKAGTDGNTVKDTCTLDMAAGYQFDFVVPQTTVAPVIQSVDFNECHPDKVVLNFDKAVLCGSLAADGSDFSITPGTHTILSMQSNCGALTYTKQVVLTLQSPLPAGNFNANIIGGSDGTTISDTCYAFVTGASSKSFVTTQAPAPVFDSAQFDPCEPSTIKVFYNRPIACNSVLASGAQWFITGPSAVTITGATGESTCTITPSNPVSYSKTFVLQLSAPITTPGAYVLHNRTVGGTTIADTCSATQNPNEILALTVLGRPSAVFNSQVIWACEEDTIIFSHPGGNGVNSWEWVFSDGSTASGQVVRHHFPITTLTINAQLTVSNGYCSDTKDQDITLGNTFTPAFSKLPKDTVCINTPVVFTDESIGSGLQYRWEFGDGNIYNAPTPPPHPYSAAGRYDVKLILTDIHGCIDTASSVMVVTATPVINFTGLKPQYCTGNEIVLTATVSRNVYAFTWDDGNGNVYPNVRTLQLRYPSESPYTISLTANDKYCADATVSRQTMIYQMPRFDLGSDTVLCPGVNMQIGTAAIPGYTYQWNTGDITPAVTTDIFTRQYILTANNNGCKSSDSIHVKILTACMIRVPTAFTPNGDGRNDKLMAVNADLAKAFSLRVYNRNGQLLFTTTDPLQGWDGTIKGNRAETGAYVWVLNYVDPWTNKAVSDKGTALLIR